MSLNPATLLQTARPPFLLLTPICVLLGYAVCSSQGYSIDLIKASLIMAAALCAHIAVNMLNEYADYASGLDLNTARTPFSGGSGALLRAPENHRATGVLGFTSLMFTAIIGAYFVLTEGFDLLPLGLLGLVIIFSYTRYLNGNPWLCLIAPGLSFGPLMVMGTERVLSGHYTELGAICSLVPFFLVNNLLLLNQLPDIEPDKVAGRRHFAIIYGKQNSIRLYSLQLSACFVVLLYLSVTGLAPRLSFVALLPLALGVRAFQQLTPIPNRVEGLVPALGKNVATTLLTPLLLALSLYS